MSSALVENFTTLNNVQELKQKNNDNTAVVTNKTEKCLNGVSETLLNGNDKEICEITKNSMNESQKDYSKNTQTQLFENESSEKKNECHPPSQDPPPQDIKMMTLGSTDFLTAKKLNSGPVYSLKQLPKFLQDSLTESLSKICITTPDDAEKIIEFIDYCSEQQLPDLTALITKDLSEPYSIYTYRYFLHNWPQLSFMVSLLIYFY